MPLTPSAFELLLAGFIIHDYLVFHKRTFTFHDTSMYVHVYIHVYLIVPAARHAYYVLYARKPDLNTIWIKHEVLFKYQFEGLICMGNSIIQQWEEAEVNFNSHHTSSVSHYPEHRFSVFWYWIHVGSNKNNFKGTKLNSSLQKQRSNPCFLIYFCALSLSLSYKFV